MSNEELECIEVIYNKDIEDFINFPDKLYKKINMQNQKLERAILLREHILSSNFYITPYIVRQNDNVVARAILTVYPQDGTGYIGFFESENNKDAVELLFNTIINKAKFLGRVLLVGPVDCSFWIKYIIKIPFKIF